MYSVTNVTYEQVMTDDNQRITRSSGLRIQITSRCNFGCSFCHGEGVTNKNYDGYEPTAESIQRGIDALDMTGLFSTDYIGLTGGNPSLRPDLADIVAALKENKKRFVAITDNGTIAIKGLYQLSSLGLDSLHISLPSHRETSFALITGSSLEEYHHVISTIKNAVTILGPNHVVVNAIILPESGKDYSKEMANLMANLGVKHVKIYVIKARTHNELTQHNLGKIQYEHMESFSHTLTKLGIQAYILLPRLRKHCSNCKIKIHCQNKGEQCLDTRIDQFGNIRPCLYTSLKGISSLWLEPQSCVQSLGAIMEEYLKQPSEFLNEERAGC